jgi:hypothetical protein
MIRSFDPEPFNEIFAEPTVRPWMGFGMEARDLAPLVRDPANYCFLTDNRQGGYILHRLDQGLYAAHTLALPAARGTPMFRLMIEGFAFMFTATDAVEIVTMVPDGNENGDRWAQIAGFRDVFRRDACFTLIDELVGASFRSLAYGDWVLRDAHNRMVGEHFHEVLVKHGAEVNHPADRVHDYWVGATIRGARRGNLAKSVALFNRWAAQAGYLPARIISVTPPVVDIHTSVIGLSPDGIEVLLTRPPLREQAEGQVSAPH